MRTGGLPRRALLWMIPFDKCFKGPVHCDPVKRLPRAFHRAKARYHCAAVFPIHLPAGGTAAGVLWRYFNLVRHGSMLLCQKQFRENYTNLAL